MYYTKCYPPLPSHLLHPRFFLSWFPTLKMYVIRSSETSIRVLTTRRYIAEYDTIIITVVGTSHPIREVHNSEYELQCRHLGAEIGVTSHFLPGRRV
jgi:hypothetical protein